MTAFTVWKFEDPDAAAHAATTLKTAQTDGLVTIVDHAVMSWPVGADKPRSPTATTTPSAEPPGARSGASSRERSSPSPWSAVSWALRSGLWPSRRRAPASERRTSPGSVPR